MSTINEEKERFWREQVALAKRHAGSLESFCRERGLRPNSLAYWRKKLGEEAPQAMALSAFIPVQVARECGAALPDPRWLAELIVELVRRES